MSDITETEKVALEKEINDIFEKFGKILITVSSSFGRGVIEELKRIAKEELKAEVEDELRDKIEVEVTSKTNKAAHEAIERILKIKKISISDFNAMERREIIEIFQELDLPEL